MADQDLVSQIPTEYTGPTNSNGDYSNEERRKGRFNINLKKYPSDLESEELKHYILFNINVRGKSEIDRSKRLFEVTRDPNSANLSQEQLASPAIRGATFTAAGAAAGIAVTSLAKSLSGAFGKTGAVSKVVSNVTGAAAGAAVGVNMQQSALLKPDTTYRISDAIALYVDGPPTVKYGMNYANKELGTLLGVLSGSSIDSSGAFKGTAEAGAAIGATLAKLPGAFGGADVASALSKSTGTALNPFKEVVFESVDFRSFTFKYKFFPKNKQESESVKEIISLFKEHMHPQLAGGKLFFIYPSEFQITYYFESKENQYFHKFRPCALESLDVVYGGEQFSSFRDGNPTEINLSMTFRELEILTRQNIRDGY